MKLFKYNQFINESNEDIHYMCKKYEIEDYIINEDGSIDVRDDVNLSQIIKLNEVIFRNVLRFRNVIGDFDCTYNKLSSLKFKNQMIPPISINGDFFGGYNNLTSLEGSPISVGGSFFCNDNKLTSLEGITQRISDNIYCYRNDLRDVRGIKEGWRGTLWIDNNPVHEIFKLFKKDRWDEVIEYLNEYDVIRDRKVVVLQALEQVYYEMDLNVPEIEYIKGYEII
jgi:hypothetical protein